MMDREPRSFSRVPGTVSEETLRTFIINAQMMGWASLGDPKLESLLLKTRESSLLQMPHFDKEVIHQLSRSIMFLKIRKNAPAPAREIPNQEFTVYPYDRNNVAVRMAIRIGASPNPDLAPIPNEVSGLVIATFVECPDFRFTLGDLSQIMQEFEGNPIKKARNQIKNITDNLNVLNILFGFGKELRNDKGYYFLAPQA